ncbi:hypothetical protein NIES2111_64230 (plasmid) [Nostoc sp. NIES-2111]|nr:hypothetical protein NIES2111_64230 [Nostoc sp. NIES-2111]
MNILNGEIKLFLKIYGLRSFLTLLILKNKFLRLLEQSEEWTLLIHGFMVIDTTIPK